MAEAFYIPALNAEHLAEAVAWALPRIACELRADVLAALRDSEQKETTARAQTAIQMLLENARIAAADQVPLCQDTGTVWVFLEAGSAANGKPLAIPADIFSLIDPTVHWVWQEKALRNSLLSDALLDRQNTNSNTPAFTELVLRPSLSGVRLTVMLKGGGSDNASRLEMLNPSDGWPAIHQLVLETVLQKAANACPPLVIGVAVGSTFDKVAALAKQALIRPLWQENPNPHLAELETELLTAINQTGIGPAGLGGETTALAVHLVTAACHLAALPVAVNLGCSAMRSVTLELTGEWA